MSEKTIPFEKESLHKVCSSMWDQSGVMMFVSDHLGQIQSINQYAKIKLGYQNLVDDHVIHLDEVISVNDQQTFLYHFYGRATKGRFIEALQTRLIKEKTITVEWSLLNRSNEHIPALLSISPLIHRQHKWDGYLFIAFDITEKKQQEKLMQATLAKEKKMGNIKSRFVTIASHEFRTPLSTILSSAHLTTKYTKEEDQYKRERHLNRIISAVNTLTDILNDFLNVGKIEEGKITIKLAQTHIEELFSAVLHDIRANAKKGQQFIYEHMGNPLFTTDQSLVRNILINLLSNAIKFSPENTTIRIFSVADVQCLQFRVEDEGIGIEQQDLEHLTKRFFRGSNAANIQGTGLGLHIVAKYVERLRGKMDCSSTAGIGTRFFIRIPSG